VETRRRGRSPNELGPLRIWVDLAVHLVELGQNLPPKSSFGQTLGDRARALGQRLACLFRSHFNGDVAPGLEQRRHRSLFRPGECHVALVIDLDVLRQPVFQIGFEHSMRGASAGPNSRGDGPRGQSLGATGNQCLLGLSLYDFLPCGPQQRVDRRLATGVEPLRKQDVADECGHLAHNHASATAEAVSSFGSFGFRLHPLIDGLLILLFRKGCAVRRGCIPRHGVGTTEWACVGPLFGGRVVGVGFEPLGRFQDTRQFAYPLQGAPHRHELVRVFYERFPESDGIFLAGE